MTHIRPDPGARQASQVVSAAMAPLRLPLCLDPARVQAAITAKRADIAAIENEWVADLERAAGRGVAGSGRFATRETWDRATWGRYLDAAAACQHQYLPRLRKLYSEIARLEQLQMPLSTTAGRAA